MTDGTAHARHLSDGTEVGMLDVTCPLCDGKGRLSRTYLYEQLGVRDMAKLATHTAKEAVAELTDKLWGKYKENLSDQVRAESEALNRDIERLKAERAELAAQNRALHESVASRESAARDAQKNEDEARLVEERSRLKDEIAALKGQVAQAQSKLEATQQQTGLDIQSALAKLKQSEEASREDLKRRIDEMNEALAQERSAKGELQTRLERAQSEVKQREFEARTAALAEKQKDIDGKSSEIASLREEIASLRAKVENFPDKERMAAQAAIQEHESKLRKLDIDLDNLRKERDGLKEELTEAQRKLEGAKGRVEERTFEDLMHDVLGIWIENKSRKGQSGDFHIGLMGPDKEPIPGSHLVVDNKDKQRVTDADVDKLVRDAQRHESALAAMVLRDESALRRKDKDARFSLINGVSVLFTTRDWFVRDLDMLRPLMRAQAANGTDFMRHNTDVAAEVRSRLVGLDAVRRKMELAAEHAQSAAKELMKWQGGVDDICRTVVGGKDDQV